MGAVDVPAVLLEDVIRLALETAHRSDSEQRSLLWAGFLLSKRCTELHLAPPFDGHLFRAIAASWDTDDGRTPEELVAASRAFLKDRPAE